MKKLWIMLLCAMVLMTTAACGASKPADTKAEDKQEAKEDDTEYEEFNRFGLFYELPKGTTEKEGDDGVISYKYEDNNLSVKAYKKDAPLTEDIATGFAGSFGNIIEEVKEVEVAGNTGYQCKVGSDTFNYGVTIVEAPQYFVTFIAFRLGDGDHDYSEFYYPIIKSIRVDESEEFVEAEEETSDYYVKGDTAVTEECTIKITGHKVLKPGQGENAYGSDTVILFEYDMTNTSGEEMSAAVEWPIIVQAVQDNSSDTVNTLRPTVLMGDNTAEVKLQKIKAGGTVHCADAFVLSDTTTPVQLIFANGTMGEELGTMTFKIK